MEHFRAGFGGRVFVPTGHPVGYGHPGFGHGYHHPFGYGPRLWNRPIYPYCECYPYETVEQCRQKRINGCITPF